MIPKRFAVTRKRVLLWAGLVVAAVLSAATVQAEIFGDYMGYEACRDCHPDIVDGWKTTPHAHAFATLKEQGAEKQQNPGCVRCHVVAFDAPGGFIDMELTPELKDVQCESCHGPGRKHIETEDSTYINTWPEEAVCRKCHTEEQDPNFEYEKKIELVHGDQ